MSSTQYEQRRVPHFDEWWESDENDLLGLVDIDVAKEIWVAAYLAGMKAEREVCAQMAEELNEIGHSYGLENRIRARGKE